MATPNTKTIHQRMVAVMAACDGITKQHTAKGQGDGYKFRGVDDAYNYLHDLLVAQGIFTVPRVQSILREERLSKAQNTLVYTIVKMEYDFVSSAGDHITIGPMIGEALDTGDKSSTKAQSIAHKMALFQVFMIPTLLSADTAEGEQHQVGSAKDFKEPMKNDDVPAEVMGQAGPEIKMASKGQWATLKNYAKIGACTGEMKQYLREKQVSLTFKQADQLIKKIEEGIQPASQPGESNE